MALGTLSIDLEARLGALQTGMDKAVRLAEKDAARMARAFDSVKAVAGGIGGALVAGLSVTAVTQFISQTNAALVAIKDLSEGTGSTVESISGLENAIRAGGGALSDIAPALVKFNGALKEADGKNGISQALKAIGLDAAELRKIDPAEALLQVARALQGFADDGNKARLVQELFGKSVAEVIPLLNDLADAGLVASDGIKEQVEQADKFEKNLAKLQTRVNDLARDISGPLVSALNKMFDTFQAGPSADLEVTRRQITLLTKYINENGSSAALPQMVARLNELRALEQRLGSQLPAGSGRPANEGGGGLGGNLRRIPDLAGAGRGGAGGRASAFKPTDFSDLGSGAFADLGVGNELPAGLQAALKAIEATDISKIAALREQLRELLDLQASGIGGAATAEAIARTREELEKMDPAAQKAAEQAQRLQEILSQTPSGAFASVLSDIELINAAFDSGKISAEQWAEAVTNATGRIGSAGTATESTNIAAKELGMTFSSALEDAIIGGKGLKDVLGGLEQDIIRIVTRKLITEPLANGLTNLLGGIMGGASGGGGGGIGGIIGSLFGGFFAEGGYLPAGKWGIAGERGPEPIFGGRTGLTVQSAGGGGSMRVINNFTISGPIDRRTQQQIAATAARAVESASRRNN
jgi:hypothetical protein